MAVIASISLAPLGTADAATETTGWYTIGSFGYCEGKVNYDHYYSSGDDYIRYSRLRGRRKTSDVIWWEVRYIAFYRNNTTLEYDYKSPPSGAHYNIIDWEYFNIDKDYYAHKPNVKSSCFHKGDGEISGDFTSVDRREIGTN